MVELAVWIIAACVIVATIGVVAWAIIGFMLIVWGAIQARLKPTKKNTAPHFTDADYF